MPDSTSTPLVHHLDDSVPLIARAVTSVDVDTIATTMASAFVDDPVFLWVMGPTDDPESRLHHMFRSLANSVLVGPGRHARLVSDGSSVAMWRDVDCWRTPTTHFLRVLPALWRTFRWRTPLLIRGFAVVERHHPLEPHLYLEALGTHADHQGRGRGGVALAPMLERCDREGLAAYTESSNPKNLPFYLRHGFVQRGELYLAPGSPPVFPLWRTPH